MAAPELEVVLHSAELPAPRIAHVVLRVGTKEERSKPAPRSMTPTWDETFRFPVTDADKECLRLIVYKQNLLFGSSEIGWIETPLKEMPMGQTHTFRTNLIMGSSTSEDHFIELTCKATGFGCGSFLRPRNPLNTYLARLVPILRLAAPFCRWLESGMNSVVPRVGQGWATVEESWYSSNMEALVPAALGLLMVMLGGTYITTIAAIEAYRMCGWDSTKQGLLLLYNEMKQARIVVSLLDDSGEETTFYGSPRSRSVRKFNTAMGAVNPAAIEEGLIGLYQGSFAVLATLRTRFAHAVTLGASLASMGCKELGPSFIPVLEKTLPDRYDKWAPLLFRYFLTFISVYLAWYLLRVFCAFHSAMYGAHLLTRGIVAYLVRQKKMTPQRADELSLPMLIWMVGLLGFCWQLKVGFRLPPPLKLALLPLTVVENFLMLIVNWDNSIV